MSDCWNETLSAGLTLYSGMDSRKTVAVSGGFDPLHIGHLELLEQARALGDELVVILNNDHWLRAKKGYVFMPEAERAGLLERYPFVDRVVLTDHSPNDPDRSVCRALQEVRPNIFANGGDRGEDTTPEADVAEQLGIEMVYGVGGGKIQSSSWMAQNAFSEANTMHRPWGFFQNHASGEGWHLKTLHINPGARLSLQQHALRAESWILVEGDATATTGDSIDSLEEKELQRGQLFHIPTGTMHRLSSRGGGVVVEVMDGQYKEEDIERFEDDFGRV